MLKASNSMVLEIIVRIVLAGIFLYISTIPAFKRSIQPEELWMYKYPLLDDIVPDNLLYYGVFITPIVVLGLAYVLTRDRDDLIKSLLSVTLNYLVMLVIVEMIKLTYGRPRPDWFYRCYPDGIVPDDKECTGEDSIVFQAWRSFPSGHSSFSFACASFLTMYLMDKLKVWIPSGRGDSLRFVVSVLPLIPATLVAISRTVDYHHHPTDVIGGAIIAITISIATYRLYYPRVKSSGGVFNNLQYVKGYSSLEYDCETVTGEKIPIINQVDVQ